MSLDDNMVVIPEKKIEPLSTVLTYRVIGGRKLDILALQGLADDLHALTCQGLPGDYIHNIQLNSDGILTVELR